MNFNVLSEDFTHSGKEVIVVTFLTSGTLAWFFLLQVYLVDIFPTLVTETFWADVSMDLFFGVSGFSALVGTLITKRVNNKKFMTTWITLGIFSTISLVLFQGILLCLFSSILLGVSLGLGLPNCLAFLSNSSTLIERGRIAGITILETFVLAFLTLTVVEILQLQLLQTLILLAIVRSFSLLTFLLDKNTIVNKRPKEDLVANLYREFVYYLIPWIMFVVAASFASNIITASSTNNLISDTQSLESIIRLGNVFRYALMALFGFLSGIVMDRVGRKTTITIGIIALGFGFALLGFLTISETIILAYFFASGVAWGTFLGVFLVIPGDLSKSGSKELFYALGTIGPLMILFSFSIIDSTWMTNLISEISPTSFSQILSTILFFSIIPVMRAKETLTKSKKRKRKLKEHIEQVEKVIHSS